VSPNGSGNHGGTEGVSRRGNGKGQVVSIALGGSLKALMGSIVTQKEKKKEVNFQRIKEKHIWFFRKRKKKKGAGNLIWGGGGGEIVTGIGSLLEKTVNFKGSLLKKSDQ